MNKKCAREGCGKTVYPLEELKCLDKVWHKGCFRCTACGMALSMKNYKGYNKMPYCEPHYPKTVATVVGDTPEMRRIAENTKIQSQAHYHAEFEKMKGTKITVADDPELMRNLAISKVVSNAEYHGEAEKRAKEDSQRPPLEEAHLNRVELGGGGLGSGGATFVEARPSHTDNGSEGFDSPYSARQKAEPTLIYSSKQGGRVNAGAARQVGTLDDYDPMNGQWGSAASSRPANLKAQTSTSPTSPLAPQSQPQQQPLRQSQRAMEEERSWNGGAAAAAAAASKPNNSTGGPRLTAGGGPYYRAMYDYSAADTDEVSFKEGDLIGDCQSVDEGWMTGTVQRTRAWGMLPANYVEKIV